MVECEEVVVTMMSTCDKALVPWNWCTNNEWFLNHGGHIDFDSEMKVNDLKKSMLNSILYFTKQVNNGEYVAKKFHIQLQKLQL